MDQSTTDPLREKRVELILQQLEGVPALAAPAPNAVAALLEACRTPQPSPPLQRLGDLAAVTAWLACWVQPTCPGWRFGAKPLAASVSSALP